MNLTCVACNTPFELTTKIFNSRKRRNKIGFFCSSECVHSWQSQNFKREREKSPQVRPQVLKNGLKRCGSCGNFSPLDNFGARSVEKKGDKYSYCKQCFSLAICKRYNAKKAAAVKFLGDRCSKCLKSYPHQVYHFHHRDPKTKKFEWVKLRNRSILSLVQELNKCDLVCANCHVLEHAGGIAWQEIESITERFFDQMRLIKA